jgi:hypothetical protein
MRIEDGAQNVFQKSEGQVLKGNTNKGNIKYKYDTKRLEKRMYTIS